MPGNNPAQASLEMVENLGKLDEFELTKEGVRPLQQQNPAEPSPQASQAGAVAEPAGSPPETQPLQPAQTPTAPAGQSQALATQPAQQVVEPTPPPVVEVVPGPEPQATQQPVTAPAPVETAPTAGAPAATPEDEAADLGKLGTFIEQQKTATLEEARRTVQSQHDRQAAQVDRHLQEAQSRTQELTQQVRELQLRDLTEPERATALAKYGQDDERGKLDAYRTELVAQHRSVLVDSLLLDYHNFGVEREAIEAIESPEEMELYCEQQKSGFLEKKLEVAASAPAPSSPPAPAQPAATQLAATEAPVQAAQPAATPQPQPNAGVPPGALAESDIGSGGAPAAGTKFSEEQGAGAMQDNLKNMRWDAVRVRQA